MLVEMPFSRDRRLTVDGCSRLYSLRVFEWKQVRTMSLFGLSLARSQLWSP